MGSLALVSGILMTLQGVIIQLNMPSFCRVTSFLQHWVLQSARERNCRGYSYRNYFWWITEEQQQTPSLYPFFAFSSLSLFSPLFSLKLFYFFFFLNLRLESTFLLSVQLFKTNFQKDKIQRDRNLQRITAYDY